jgi:hypothetical protein
MIANYPKNTIKDTTAEIWDILYFVRIPYLATMSIDHIREFGIPTTGDKNTDRSQASQLITTYLSIAKLVDYHREGIPIRIINSTDIPKIYAAIANHLDAWKVQLSNGLNIGDAPIEDLLAMDRFANDVYRHAKYDMVNQESDSSFVRALAKFSIFGKNSKMTNIIKDMSKDTDQSITINKIGEDNIPDRESISDLLKKTMITSTRFRSKL